MKFNTDHTWLKRLAELEDIDFVSVGGLIASIEELQQKPAAVELTRPAFVRLLELARREHRMSLEQFAETLDIELAELIGIQNDEHYRPTAPTVNKLAHFLNVPEQKLFVLAGLVRAEDERFQAEALLFAARSQPVQKLTAEEHEALEQYVKFLCASVK